MVRRIILDTDLGEDCDDTIALGYAIASPEIELVAVTVVGASDDSLFRAMATRNVRRARRPHERGPGR